MTLHSALADHQPVKQTLGSMLAKYCLASSHAIQQVTSSYSALTPTRVVCNPHVGFAIINILVVRIAVHLTIATASSYVVDYCSSDGDYGISDGDYGSSDGDYGISDGDYGSSDGDYGISDGDYGISDGDYGIAMEIMASAMEISYGSSDGIRIQQKCTNLAKGCKCRKG